MTNILVECPELIASVKVGVLRPLRPLEDRGACTVRFRRTREVRKRDVAWCDVYICVRGFELASVVLAKTAKRAGRFVVYFLDDDLADIPADIPSADFVRRVNGRDNMLKILGLADVIWAVNALLAEKYSRWCQRTVLSRVPAVPTAVRGENYSDGPVRVLYAGSTDHEPLVRKELAPAVRRLTESFPGKYEFTFIGADPGLKDMENVRYYHFFDSYDEYRSTVEKGRFMLGLAPIKKGFFYRCKYYNKFVEYASSGILGIYTAQDPYTQIVEDGHNGYLCDGTPEGWSQAILRAAGDRNGALQCALNAHELLEKDFSPQAVADQLERDVGELTGFKASKVAIPWLIVPVNIYYYAGRIKYNIRAFGFLAFFVLAFKLVRWIWKHLILRKD